jgi:hypothetical protein
MSLDITQASWTSSASDALTVAETALPSGMGSKLSSDSTLTNLLQSIAAGEQGALSDVVPVSVDGLHGLRGLVHGVLGSSTTIACAVVVNGDTEIMFMASPSDDLDDFVATYAK